jgi:hypothetical protein
VPNGVRPDSRPTSFPGRARVGSVALGVGTAVAAGAVLVLVYAGVTTASARIAGNTDNRASLLAAAAVALEADPTASGQASTDLLVDADGLYPGLVVERCLPVRYTGSLSLVAVVLSARVRGGTGPGGTGLERYLDTTIEVGQGQQADCGDFSPAGTGPTFTGTLGSLAAQHPSYEQGLTLFQASTGEPVTVRFRFEVLADNAAQGRSTDLTFRFEVRP